MSEDDSSRSPAGADAPSPSSSSESVPAGASAASSPPVASSSPPPLPPSPPLPRRAQRLSVGADWLNPWLLVAVVALGVAAWQWLETRHKLAGTQQELARRLAESDTAASETRALARQAEERTSSLQERFGALEARIAESQSQQATLEKLFQDLARNRDEWALAEIEQSVTLASQQLQLSGNVPGAVAALQSADSRLAAGGRPQLLALRKAIGRDLERLRALPLVDLPGMNLRLESVIVAVDSLPLAIDARPRAEAPPPAVSERAETNAMAGVLRQFAADIWQEFRGLVRIQRFDRDEPVLLAPGQAFFLRENLKLRLLNARLALLARDQTTFRNELQQAREWLGRHFDARAAVVQEAQATLKSLSGAEIGLELPSLNESLSAIRSLQMARERK
ncbi:hypothetical protein HCX48_08830 [Rhodocyclus tenuis]|uniref:Uroporphyrin-3 C-methyltransferase n=1 Tax=Rhodocyclus gracilis TaxID=2929842 RepID=A0ABX0WHY3_9RHOO|nr:hypothetical protein [Rhodocyclus gracilis]